MKPRYEAYLKYESSDTWNVRDNDAKQYKMPADAVTLNLRESAANRMAQILNEEWQAFLANPQ